MQHLIAGRYKQVLLKNVLVVTTSLLACVFNTTSGQDKASQFTINAPKQLSVDLIYHPERVYKNGSLTNIALASINPNDHRFLQYTKINSPFPGFSWVVPTQITKQRAYQLLVATSAAAINQDLNASDPDLIWNSAKQRSDQNLHVPYKGPALKPNTVYYWKVRIWGEPKQDSSTIVQSPFSSIQAFKTGAPLSKSALPGFVLSRTRQLPVSDQALAIDYHIYDFGKDGFSQPRLKIRATKADTIQILLAEKLTPGGKIDTNPPGTVRFAQIALPVKKGVHDYQVPIFPDKRNTKSNAIKMPAYIGEVLPFRYLAIQGDLTENIPIAVTRSLIHLPFDQDATVFSSSDSILNQVWDLCKYTIKATDFTGYYVDGDRERIAYEADALINQLSGYCTSTNFNVAKRTLDYLIYHPTWPTEWSLQNPLIAYNDYMYSGDVRHLASIYKQLKPKVLTALEDANGLISTRTGKQSPAFLQSIHYKVFDGNPGLKDIVDWPHTKKETDGFVFTDYNAVVNAFYYKALNNMALLARALKKPKDAAYYQNKAAHVKLAYLKHFVSTSTGLMVDGIQTKHSSLHANMFALAFGLVPKANIEQVLHFIKSRGVSCSVYGAQFLLEALGEMDHSNYALKLLTSKGKRSWYNMIREGATMTMEAWGQAFKPNQDWNHAWGTAPANYIVRFLMGIRPIKPGFAEIQVKPHPGRLDSASIRYLTVRGNVLVQFTNTVTEFTLKVTIPGNTTARICLPVSDPLATITMDGQPVQPITGQDKYYQVIPRVSAGQHTFRVLYP